MYRSCRSIVFVLVVFAGSMHQHPTQAQVVQKGGNYCNSFTKAFASGSVFKAAAWAKPEKESLLIPEFAPETPLTLKDQKVTIVTKETGGTAKELTLIATKDKIPLNNDGVIAKEGIRIKLTNSLNVPISELTKNQRAILRNSARFADWLHAAEHKTGGLFHIKLGYKDGGNQTAFQNAVLTGALAQLPLAVNKEQFVIVKSFDDQEKTVTVVIEESTKLMFGNQSKLNFTLPFPVALNMVAPDLSSGGLEVIGSKRAIERTTLNLALTRGSTPFETTTIRGCLGLMDNDKKLVEVGNDDLTWIPIENVILTAPAAGKGRAHFVIPTFPTCGVETIPCPDADKNPYTPGKFATLSQMASGGKENVRLMLVAADENGILYTGTTSHFIDDRYAAFWSGLAAFILAYVMIFFFRGKQRAAGGNDDTFKPKGWSPLHIIRGHNGTASLSNLQILWWTLAVFSLMIYSWVASGGLAALNDTIMWLLGIGGAGSLAAKAVAINAQEENAEVADLRNPRAVPITWWDLISVNGRLDLTKLQMLLFTVVAGIYVVTTVWRQVTFPEIPAELLALMGISNGLYVLGKLTTSNPYAEVGILIDKKQIIEEKIANLVAEESVFTDKISKLTEGKTAQEKLALKAELDLFESRQTEIKVELGKLKSQETRLETAIEQAKEKISSI